jgi:hypothetical protein
MSLGNATFGGFIVGQASRLPSNDLPTQARRPRYIQKSKSKLLLVEEGGRRLRRGGESRVAGGGGQKVRRRKYEGRKRLRRCGEVDLLQFRGGFVEAGNFPFPTELAD